MSATRGAVMAAAQRQQPMTMAEMENIDDTLGPLAPEDWPNIDHLITEDDTPVDNIYSEKQQRLLTESLYASWRGPGEGHPFVAFANVGLYNSVKERAQVSDVMVSLDVELPEDIWEKRHRSYMIWEYGKAPEVVIEIVSNQIGGEDSTKLQKYARMAIAHYVIYDPYQYLSNQVLRFYTLTGATYVEMDNQWLSAIDLGLMLWPGEFEAWEDTWLRWCDRDGNMLLTGAERAKQERQRAEQERQRAEKAEEKLQQLAAQLRALGIEPEIE